MSGGGVKVISNSYVFLERFQYLFVQCLYIFESRQVLSAVTAAALSIYCSTVTKLKIDKSQMNQMMTAG
jgi:hypothetical protein